MTRDYLALVEVLSDIPDFRKSKGKRHPLSAILALAAAAMLCGFKSYSAIAEWGRIYGDDLARALGFTHKKTPCASTLHTIFSNIDKDLFEGKLSAWAEAVTAATPCPHTELEAFSLDGKTLRGSRKQGALGAHLLSALGQRLGLTMAQKSVSDQTNEIPVAQEMLSSLVVEGRVFTMDALLTQRQIASEITRRGGDYVMVVKENQPELLSWIKAVLDEPVWLREAPLIAEQSESAHGRIETRKLLASSVLAGEGLWPSLQQVFRIERSIIKKKTGKVSQEVVYGVSSLKQQRADAATLMKVVRGQWLIENKSHWVRDVTYDEDRSQVRRGSIPQVMAALRNTVIGLMRWAGETNIAAACRRFAAQPWAALALIGINPEN